MRLESYHHAWLSRHPERSREWLVERLAEGFHVHHADGNHGNDAPKNLILVEGLDHMMILHGLKVASIIFGERSRLMNDLRHKKVSPAKRRMIAKRAARIRWKRVKRNTDRAL